VWKGVYACVLIMLSFVSLLLMYLSVPRLLLSVVSFLSCASSIDVSVARWCCPIVPAVSFRSCASTDVSVARWCSS
jgi:hypothetical protein